MAYPLGKGIAKACLLFNYFFNPRILWIDMLRLRGLMMLQYKCVPPRRSLNNPRTKTTTHCLTLKSMHYISNPYMGLGTIIMSRQWGSNHHMAKSISKNIRAHVPCDCGDTNVRVVWQSRTNTNESSSYIEIRSNRATAAKANTLEAFQKMIIMKNLIANEWFDMSLKRLPHSIGKSCQILQSLAHSLQHDLGMINWCL